MQNNQVVVKVVLLVAGFAVLWASMGLLPALGLTMLAAAAAI